MAETVETWPTALRNADTAATRYGDFGRRWLDAMWLGDPLADAVVADFAKLAPGQGHHMLHRAVLDGVDAVDDAPGSLIALFAELDDEPGWVDHDRCDRASEHLARHTSAFAFVLGAASLLAGAHNTLAGKPLTFTGRYATQAGIRSIEVGSWLTATTTPGGLLREGIGFERTVRVRLIHAHVRARLAHAPEWDHDAWGVPICQAYMAFTIVEFGAIALRAMHQLGARYTDGELDDIFHLWRVVGRLVGMDDDLNPASADDHARIEELFQLVSPGPDDGDRAFVAALGDFQVAELDGMLPGWLGPLRPDPAAIVHGLQRAFVGDEIADDLHVPDTSFKQLPAVLGALVAAGCRAYDLVVPDGKARRTERGFERRNEQLRRLKDRYAVRHELVDDTR